MGGPIGITRYNMYTSAAVNGAVPPDFSTGETIQSIDRLANQTLPTAMRTEWTELMFLQLRAGNTALIVFGLAVLSVFLTLAALMKIGRCRWQLFWWCRCACSVRWSACCGRSAT